MKEENYQRACEIKKRLLLLVQHKYELENARFSETHAGLSFRYNAHHSEVKLMDDITPPDFHGVYLGLLDVEIQRLEHEFSNL